MARYIDAETALKIVDSYAKTVSTDGKVIVDAIRDIIAVITPTADVAPKSEVAREIFEEIEKVIGDKYNRYVFGNNDLDSMEQDAIINFSDDVSACFAELKKKYTEGKT